MVVSEIELFEVLWQQPGAEKAKILVKYVEAKVIGTIRGKHNTVTYKRRYSQPQNRNCQCKS